MQRRILNCLDHKTPVSWLHFEHETNEQRILAQRPLVWLIKLSGVFMTTHLSQNINKQGGQRAMLSVRS